MAVALSAEKEARYRLQRVFGSQIIVLLSAKSFRVVINGTQKGGKVRSLPIVKR